jgi:hypothetical protein
MNFQIVNSSSRDAPSGSRAALSPVGWLSDHQPGPSAGSDTAKNQYAIHFWERRQTHPDFLIKKCSVTGVYGAGEPSHRHQHPQIAGHCFRWYRRGTGDFSLQVIFEEEGSSSGTAGPAGHASTLTLGFNLRQAIHPSSRQGNREEEISLL